MCLNQRLGTLSRRDRRTIIWDKTLDAYRTGTTTTHYEPIAVRNGRSEGGGGCHTAGVACTHVVLVVAHAVHPEAHGHAYEHGARRDQTDADVPDGGHGLRVVVGQPQPVEQRADAHQRHAEPVRPLRFLRHDQRHFFAAADSQDTGCSETPGRRRRRFPLIRVPLLTAAAAAARTSGCY